MLGISPAAVNCLFSQPKGRAFLADFRPRGRRRSSDRLTSTRTKLPQELLRALRKNLCRAYLEFPSFARSVPLTSGIVYAIKKFGAVDYWSDGKMDKRK